MELRKTAFSAFIIILLVSAISVCQPDEEVIGEREKVGVIQIKNPALAGIDKLCVTVIPDRFCYGKGIDASTIEESIKEIFSKAGIEISPAEDVEEAEFIIRIAGNDFESVICATHVQSSLARKVYLRKPRAVSKAEIWRLDVPIRFSSPDAAKEAIMAEVTKQAQAFAEQWKLSYTGKVQPPEGTTDSATTATGKYDKNAQKEEPIKYPYVASKNSKVFHRADCRAAGRISKKNLIGFESREQAIESGRRPCKICNP